ncbi:hypothetical protein J132_10855 [Termitomyces sp. J132]|nr:hypothetical protein J132_10855 [Termitomyces sp. J132]
MIRFWMYAAYKGTQKLSMTRRKVGSRASEVIPNGPTTFLTLTLNFATFIGMDESSSSWRAILKSTLKVICLVIAPRPIFSFPASNPSSSIPIVHRNIRYSSQGSPSTSIHDAAWSFSLNSPGTTFHGPTSSTPQHSAFNRHPRKYPLFNSSLANVLPQEAPLSSAIRQSTIANGHVFESASVIKYVTIGHAGAYLFREFSGTSIMDDNLADTSFTSHKPLRRSTRIGAGLVQGGQLQTTNGLNEAHTHAPDLISQIPSPKRTHVPARRSQASSPSFSSQSRYFELDLSPIIESPATMAPLAPSAVISGEGEDMLAYSLTGDVSPDSSSNLEDMVLPPNRTKRSEGSKETARSEARNVVIIKRDLHPKTLVTVPGDLSNQNNDSLDIRSRKEHIPSAAIPAVVLTVPTPDLPNQSRDVKVSSVQVTDRMKVSLSTVILNLDPVHWDPKQIMCCFVVAFTASIEDAVLGILC